MGVALYLILCGKLPFPGRTVEQVCDAVVHLEPIPPRELQPDAPEALEQICLAALQKDPTLRYRSAGELASDLEAYLRGGNVLAGRVTLALRLRRAARLLRLHATTVAAAGAVVVVALVLAGAARLVSNVTAGEAARALTTEATDHRTEAARSIEAARTALDAGRVEEAAAHARDALGDLRWSAALTARSAAAEEADAQAASAEARPQDDEVAAGRARDASLVRLEAEALALRGLALTRGAAPAGAEEATRDLLQAVRAVRNPSALEALIELAADRGDASLAAELEPLLASSDAAPSPDELRARAALAACRPDREPVRVWRPHLGRDDALGRAARTLEAGWRPGAGEPRRP